MKSVVASIVCASLAFWAVYAINYRKMVPPEIEVAAVQNGELRAAFPGELAPAAKGDAVAKAAEWKREPNSAKVTVLSVKGSLHDWHDKLKPEWRSDSVEDTELVLVLGDQVRTLVDTDAATKGRPEIHYYDYHLNAWLLEARTGTVLGKHQFFTLPGSKQVGSSGTEIGSPVAMSTVRQWLNDTVQVAAKSQPAPRPENQPAVTPAVAEPEKKAETDSQQP